MPLLEAQGWFASLKLEYELAGQYYFGGGINRMRRGVKIHVSGKTSSIECLGKAILPYLNTQGAPNKILADTGTIAKAKDSNQARKFITVYPQDADQLDEWADGIDAILCSRSFSGRIGAVADCYKIEGDLPYGRAGYLFLRHGVFDGDDTYDDRSEVSQQLKAYYIEDKVEGLFERNPRVGASE